ENRKYGEGMIIVEQVPAKLIEDAHKNTALKVMHHLPAAEDRQVIADTMNLSEDQQIYAQALDPLAAYTTHRGLGGQSGLIEVPNVRGMAAAANGVDEDPLPGSEVARGRFIHFTRPGTSQWDLLAPYAECTPCQSRCQFRDISEVSAAGSVAEVRAATRAGAVGSRSERYDALRAAFRSRAGAFPEFTSPTQRHDLARCLFLHAARAAYPGKNIEHIVRRFDGAVSESEYIDVSSPPEGATEVLDLG
ncbi:MAG: hypothetical protein ACRC0L_07210, partial [Angustibacter sp.]